MQPTSTHLRLTPQVLQAKMKLDPQQTQQLNRIVAAGMKVMFAPQTRHLLQQALQGNAPVGQKVGLAVTGLMGLLMKESQNSLPLNLLVPAGTILVAHGIEFLAHAGAKVTDKDTGMAIEVMHGAVLKAYKLDDNKIAALGERFAKPGAHAPQQGV